jgi:hypothetical protein
MVQLSNLRDAGALHCHLVPLDLGTFVPAVFAGPSDDDYAEIGI